jgi:WS/DGAT/MGAT family acyltransferase
MTNVDAAWLRMDQPTNLMIINGVMLFDKPLAFDCVQRVLEERLVGRFARFRQRVVEWPSGSRRIYWEDDPYYDIRLHLRRIALPAPGDTAALQLLVGDLMSESLDHNRPLWRFYLIENYGGGCAVFGRIHHCIADGIALIQVLMSLTDGDAEPPVQVVNRNSDSSGAPWPSALRQAATGVEMALEAGRALRADPAAAAYSAGITVAASAAVLAKLLILSPDRTPAFKGELNAVKRVVWSEPLDLDDVKAIGRATQTTVNDVLVAMVAGALRRYLLAHGQAAIGESPIGEDVRAMVPVNLRPPSDKLRLGNEFSLVYLALPVSIAGPMERLMATKQRMDHLKRSPEAWLVYKVVNFLGMAPGEVAQHATDWFAAKASCVLTNVPGPRQTLYFAGQRISRILFWVPQSGGIGMGISIISYAGSVSIGLVVDDGLIQDPQRILNESRAEFDELYDATVVSSRAPGDAAMRS